MPAEQCSHLEEASSLCRKTHPVPIASGVPRFQAYQGGSMNPRRTAIWLGSLFGGLLYLFILAAGPI
ncbi:hypothetical protein FA406_12000 [Pseudomonas aeruginosa]|nr:hypothetical protein [Pseudomonas aeruginosa]